MQVMPGLPDRERAKLGAILALGQPAILARTKASSMAVCS
jgi:hypothetical protein